MSPTYCIFMQRLYRLKMKSPISPSPCTAATSFDNLKALERMKKDDKATMHIAKVLQHFNYKHLQQLKGLSWYGPAFTEPIQTGWSVCAEWLMPSLVYWDNLVCITSPTPHQVWLVQELSRAGYPWTCALTLSPLSDVATLIDIVTLEVSLLLSLSSSLPLSLSLSSCLSLSPLSFLFVSPPLSPPSLSHSLFLPLTPPHKPPLSLSLSLSLTLSLLMVQNAIAR